MLAPVLLAATALRGSPPPRDGVEGVRTLTHIGGERIAARVSAVGVGADGRLVFRDATGRTVAGASAVCPPDRPSPPRETGMNADIGPGRRAIAVSLFDETYFEWPSLYEVRISVRRTGEVRSVAIPVADGGQVREARQVFVVPCGLARRTVLVVAEAAETTGIDMFEVTFRHAEPGG